MVTVRLWICKSHWFPSATDGKQLKCSLLFLTHFCLEIRNYESRTSPWTAGLTGYLHCTTLPSFGQIRRVESRVCSIAFPTSAAFRASDLTVNVGIHPTVLDCSLLSFGTGWCSRLTRFVGTCRLHLHDEENYSKSTLKVWLWGRQNMYSKFAQPVARRQHVARETVLCCPRRYLKWDKAF